MLSTTPEVRIPDYQLHSISKSVDFTSAPSHGITYQNHSVYLLRTEDLLQLIPRTSIIPRLLQHHIIVIQGLEYRIDLTIGTRSCGVAEASHRAGEGSVAEFRTVGVGEEDASEDTQGGRVLLVHTLRHKYSV